MKNKADRPDGRKRDSKGPAPKPAGGSTKAAQSKTPFSPRKGSGHTPARGAEALTEPRQDRRPSKPAPERSADAPATPKRGTKPGKTPTRPFWAMDTPEEVPPTRPRPSKAKAPQPVRSSATKGDSPAPRGPKPAERKEQSGQREPRPMPTLQSGQTVELKIVSVNDDGFGVAQHQGTRVLVAGGLPGEQLVARVTYVGRRETFGTALKWTKISPDRNNAPACKLGRSCEGCMLMQMRYQAQLGFKKSLVAKEIGKYPSLMQAAIHDTIASPSQLGYRNSVKLVVAGKHSDPIIGIYKRNSHNVLDIQDCPLHHPLINQVVRAAKAAIRKGKVPIYNPKSEMGLLRYLVVRVAEPGDQVMVVLVTSDQGYNEIHHLAKQIQQTVPQVAVVAQNINASTGNVIFGQRDRFITKLQTLRAQIGALSFVLSPRSFFQVNSGAAGIIYQKVREFAKLTGSERVIDLYCGIGGISLFLADQAQEVVGIEVVDSAVEDAAENARLNGLENCHFEAGDAAKLLDEIGAEGGAQLIVLNPPRKGCEEKVLRSAAALQPEKIVYVSCSPETLARDLDILAKLGYRTLEVQPVDMFPQTVHIEDVALLVRQ